MGVSGTTICTNLLLLSITCSTELRTEHADASFECGASRIMSDADDSDPGPRPTSASHQHHRSMPEDAITPVLSQDEGHPQMYRPMSEPYRIGESSSRNTKDQIMASALIYGRMWADKKRRSVVTLGMLSPSGEVKPDHEPKEESEAENHSEGSMNSRQRGPSGSSSVRSRKSSAAPVNDDEAVSLFLEAIFAGRAPDVVVTDAISMMLQNVDGQGIFSRILNDRRAICTDISDKTCFEMLSRAVHQCIESAATQENWGVAKLMMHLCFTYCYVDTISNKIFLTNEMKGIDLWSDMAFWQEAFYDALSTEMQAQRMSKRWQNLDVFSRMDVVTREENIAFGQLGCIAHNMIDLGVSLAETRKFVEKMGMLREIPTEMQAMLMANLSLAAEEEEANDLKVMAGRRNSWQGRPSLPPDQLEKDFGILNEAGGLKAQDDATLKSKTRKLGLISIIDSKVKKGTNAVKSTTKKVIHKVTKA